MKRLTILCVLIALFAIAVVPVLADDSDPFLAEVGGVSFQLTNGILKVSDVANGGTTALFLPVPDDVQGAPLGVHVNVDTGFGNILYEGGLQPFNYGLSDAGINFAWYEFIGLEILAINSSGNHSAAVASQLIESTNGGAYSLPAFRLFEFKAEGDFAPNSEYVQDVFAFDYRATRLFVDRLTDALPEGNTASAGFTTARNEPEDMNLAIVAGEVVLTLKTASQKIPMPENLGAPMNVLVADDFGTGAVVAENGMFVFEIGDLGAGNVFNLDWSSVEGMHVVGISQDADNQAVVLVQYENLTDKSVKLEFHTLTLGDNRNPVFPLAGSFDLTEGQFDRLVALVAPVIGGTATNPDA